jgi:hypothetical protein
VAGSWDRRGPALLYIVNERNYSHPYAPAPRRLFVGITGNPNAAFLSTSGEVAQDGNFTIPDAGIVQYRINLLGLPPDAYIVFARLGGADILEKGVSVRGDPPGPLEVTVSGAANGLLGLCAPLGMRFHPERAWSLRRVQLELGLSTC